MKKKLESVSERCSEILGTTSDLLVMGGGDNHRHSLLLPKRYKWNRDDTRRPELLSEVRSYVRKRHNCVDVKDIEADDYIAAMGYQGWKHWKKTGVFSYAQVCEDKDALGSSSLILNPRKQGGEWVHDTPVCVDGIGEIYIDEKGKARGQGFVWLMFQTYGDKTDGYDLNYFTNKRLGFGDVARVDSLKDCTTPNEMLQAVLDSYHKLFGPTLEYVAWDGTEVSVPTIEGIDMIFTCAYMLKTKNDKTSFSGLCKKYGVDVEYNKKHNKEEDSSEQT